MRGISISRGDAWTVIAAVAGLLAAVFVAGRVAGVSVRPAPDTALEGARVGRASVSTSLSATGQLTSPQQVVLAFQTAGQIKEVLVKEGDQVTIGQPLARIDSSDLATRVEIARAQLSSTEARRGDLLATPTQTDVASAQQSVVSAQGALLKTTTDYNNMRFGGSFADLAAAQQSFANAQASLSQATNTLNTLRAGAKPEDVAAARLAVAQAQVTLTNAQNNRDKLVSNGSIREAAQSDLNSKYATLAAAYTSCLGTTIPIVAGQSAPSIPANDCAVQPTQLQKNAALHAYGSASLAYQSAVSALNAVPVAPSVTDIALANAQVTSAQLAYGLVYTKLLTTMGGPTPTDLAVAGSAHRGTHAAFLAAQAKLDALQHPTAQDLTVAELALQAAQATLDAAQARLRETLGGPKATDIQSQQASVLQAQVSFTQATTNLANATLTAPFAGMVTAIALTVGQNSSASTTVTLFNPQALQVSVSVGESDVPLVKMGQNVTVTVDALTGRSFRGTVVSVAKAAIIQQGVASFPVVVVTQAGAADGVQPGMTASISIITAQQDNVLVVPSRAIRRGGTQQVVDVIRDGKRRTEPVVTGLAGAQTVEVKSGLSEGDIVVLPATTTGTRTTTTAAPAGNFGGGFGVGGGGAPPAGNFGGGFGVGGGGGR